MNAYHATIAELEQLTTTIDEGDVETLAQVHLDLAELKHRVTLAARAVEERLADVMPDKRLELPGLPVMERKKGTDRKKWQSGDLLDELLRHAAFDAETGAVIDDELILRQRIHETLTACVPFTGSLGWRVTALRDLGLDPDEWCETAPGRISVVIHGDTDRGEVAA